MLFIVLPYKGMLWPGSLEMYVHHAYSVSLVPSVTTSHIFVIQHKESEVPEEINSRQDCIYCIHFVQFTEMFVCAFLLRVNI